MENQRAGARCGRGGGWLLMRRPACNVCQRIASVSQPELRMTRVSSCTLCLTLVLCSAMSAGAQSASNPRFGRWLLQSDAPPPASNVMTYEPFGTRGMKVTIESVSAKGDTARWWYTTEFDGREMPVTGNANQTHAAVRTVSPRINEIVNLNAGRVTQRLTNVLSPDHNTIGVIYMREGADGVTGAVTFATYRRIR
jgi:hypothetical protein